MLEMAVVVLSKGENRIWKQVLKEEDLQWKGEVENLRLGDLLDVLCKDNGDPEPGNPWLDGLECQRFLQE